MAAATAFRNTVFSTSNENAGNFSSLEARKTRYMMNWAFYEGKQYDALSDGLKEWVNAYKIAKGLYKYIRNIYNPVLRLGDFWTQAIWRGSIDADAGDSGAIPITVGKKAVENKLRPVIASIMKNSNWNVNKDILTLHGTILGDAVIYIRDDREHEQSRLEVMHPSNVVMADLDSMGFVKAYMIEYPRIDNDGREAMYRETAEHGEAENEIIFKTYRDETLYAWDGNTDQDGNPVFQWSVFYGFIPLVLIQHKNVGLPWGLCEFHADVDKISEVNDEQSMMNDQIRKTINVKWLANWAKADQQTSIPASSPTTDRPQQGREDTGMIHINKADAKIQPFVAPLELDKVITNVEKMLGEWEDDLPELKSEVWSGGSGPSDSTILAARGRVEGKVEKRRAGYDSGFVRAVQMAITIGAVSKYPGYTEYSVDSYKNGALDFSISVRPAFPPQPSEIAAAKKDFWDGWSKVKDTVPFKTYARDMGWSDEQIEQAMIDFQEMTGETIPASGQ